MKTTSRVFAMTLLSLVSLAACIWRTPAATTISVDELRLCQKLMVDMTGESKFQGTLVLSPYSFPPILANLGTGIGHSITEGGDSKYFQILSVSPDQTLLAYEYYHFEDANPFWELRIIDSHNRMLNSIKMQESWQPFMWIDGQYWLSRPASNPDVDIIFNPFTGKQFELENRLVDYASYNADLTRALHSIGNPRTEIDLVDMSTKLALARIPVITSQPYRNWSSDGTHLAIISNKGGRRMGEVYIVSRDGDLTQITNLSKTFIDYKFLPFLAFSPDNRYLSFTVRVNPDSSSQQSILSIFDTTTGKVTEYCNPDNLSVFYGVVWSPDSKYLVVNYNDPNLPNGINKVFILDVAAGKAFWIFNSESPDGWLR